jgi:hypothetical protein
MRYHQRPDPGELGKSSQSANVWVDQPDLAKKLPPVIWLCKGIQRNSVSSSSEVFAKPHTGAFWTLLSLWWIRAFGSCQVQSVCTTQMFTTNLSRCMKSDLSGEKECWNQWVLHKAHKWRCHPAHLFSSPSSSSPCSQNSFQNQSVLFRAFHFLKTRPGDPVI